MEANFSKPQRQSLIGVLVLFVDSLIKEGKALVFILLLRILQHKTMQWNVFLSIAGCFAIYFIVASYLKYLNFTFYIDEEADEFIIKEGVFGKTKTIIQLNKIQQVNIKQTLIQRIIGIYAFDVDTAGTDKKEASIKAISHEVAVALKAKLLENESKTLIASASEEKEVITSVESPFLKINLLSLLKIGVTSRYVETIGLILVFYFTVLDDLKKIGFDYFPDSEKLELFFKENGIGYMVLFMALVVIVIVFMINIVRTLIKFFDYTITKQKGSLVLHYGLFDTKSTLLKPEKIQTIIVSRNYFQKKLDILSLKIKQSVGRSDKSSIEIPGCNAMESDEILKLLFNQLPKKGTMMKPNFRKLAFSVFLRIILPLTAYVLYGKFVNATVFDYKNLAVGFAVFYSAVLLFGFRHYRLFVSDDYIMRQSGAWDVHTEIVRTDKIQALTTSQLFWHKSLNIGSLTIHTSGGNITFELGQFDKVKEYVNLWLYKLETSDSNWM